MSKIKEALNFLKDDLSQAAGQWTDKGYTESMLQRNDCTLDDLLDKFDPADDEADWLKEYSGDMKAEKLRLYRKRLSFLKASRKEWREEYDPGISDVDFMRLLEVPYTDPKYAIDGMLLELGED